MKILLILINLLLAGALIREGVLFFKPPQTVGYTVGKDRSHAKTAKPAAKLPAKPAPAPPLSPVDAAQVVTKINIFDSSRCPDAQFGRGPGGGNTQMQLVGVYRIGGQQGAVIVQRRQGPNRRQMMENMMNGRWMRNVQQQAQAPLKQFFRVGDTLENGYTLAMVETDRVILSRNGATMELALENAGRSATASSGRRNMPNAQQMQGMMMMQGMQLMRTMQQQLMQQQRNNSGTRTQVRSGARTQR